MQNFSEYANTLRRKMKFSKEETIFVCIGSNKVVWDSIGPYVGSILKEKIGEKYVIGDLENNICSQKDLKSYYPIVKNKFVVAIDSAITENNLSGEIFVTEKPIVMGMGVYQNKGIVGEIGIKAGIDREFCNERYILDISRIIVEGICFCIGDGFFRKIKFWNGDGSFLKKEPSPFRNVPKRPSPNGTIQKN